MIRDSKLIDKLIADLHFHNYLFVVEGDNVFTNRDENIENVQSIINSLGLDDKLNAHTDFYHGGNVLTKEKTEYLNNYIDDVFIDLFFRTHNLKPIVIPKELSQRCISKDGIIKSNHDLYLNLNNLFDRCTFLNCIWQLFGLNNGLMRIFPENSFINKFYINKKIFGVHAFCYTLKNQFPFDKELCEYNYYTNKKFTNRCDGIEYYTSYFENISHNPLYNCATSFLYELHKFKKSFFQIKDSHIFGDYSIEDILFLYSLLTDKFSLRQDSFILCLCYCLRAKVKENTIFKDFKRFENQNHNSNILEPFIIGQDLYLRFASHTKSRAFKFKYINDVCDEILIFNKKSSIMVKHSNTMPLPYLYQKLNNLKLCM